MTLEKRFKGVQDSNGRWGILDTVAEEFELLAFAPFSGSGGCIGLIAEFAAKMNSGEASRDNLVWDEYEPRKNIAA